MAIDRSGEWWKGSSEADLDEYLREYTEDGYPVGPIVHAVCPCGGNQFRLRCDDTEGYAERRCRSCKATVVMLDSADYEDEAEPEDAQCPCGAENFNIAVGFSLTAKGRIKWISVGLRCVKDGVLGVYADWKIDYEPSDHLLSAV
jgi:hypothetical protein